MARRSTALAAALLGLAAFAYSAAAMTARTSEDKTFRASNVPFTFRYPGEFKRHTIEAQGVNKKVKVPALALDNLNLILVRDAGRRIPDAKLESYVRDLLRQVRVRPYFVRKERHSGRAMVAASVPNKVSGKATISDLYFFSGPRGTWELECQSTRERRTQLRTGCSRAVNSIRFN